MIIKVYRDELYPYFRLDDIGYEGTWTDLDEQQVKWIEETLVEFNKVQDLLGDIYYGNYA